MYTFLTDYRKTYIISFIKKKILINLIDSEFQTLMLYLLNIIEYIVIRFGFDCLNYNDVWNQLIKNNNQDIISIFYILLPYIDDKNNFELFKKINYLKDITMLKKNLNEQDKSKNNYEISNYQYSIYIDEEIKFDIKFIQNNYYLLLSTIDQISNKLYVNWIQIVPLINYKESYLYKNSVKFKNLDGQYKLYYPDNTLVNDEDNYTYLLDNNFKINYKNKGISIGDIYNTLYYHLYLNILDIKWFIYQGTFENKLHDEIYIKKFHEYIAIDELYFNINWNELSEILQNKFTNRWYKILDKIIEDLCYYNFIKKIMIYFEKNYIKINAIKKDYNYIGITKENFSSSNDSDDEEEDLHNNNNNFINNIKLIPIEDIYNYFQDSVQLFMKTWYGKKIIKIENENIHFISLYFENNEFYYHKIHESINIKYKFIYNYAKTLISIYDIKKNKSYILSDWYNSDFNYSFELLNRLNYNYTDLKDDREISPMNFLKYLERTYKISLYDKNVPEANINSFVSITNDIELYISNPIIESIKEKLIDIVFETHVFKGLYSCYNFNENIKYDIFKNSYYYLTNQKYDNLQLIEVDPKNPKNIIKKTFLDLIELKKYKWHTYYAMDWISQINFFHKFINNRVIFITGSTGTGKSTQVPKLLLYGLTMIDNNSNGKIGCTAPRINPVKNNVSLISWQLGVPVFENSINYKKTIKTFNSNVQYDTRDEKHIVADRNILLLKILTDGLLLNEIINSPILKKIQKTNDKNEIENIDFNSKIYKKENIYDIIVIDEAHEHNTNMDMILTCLRDTIKINNSLRLIIISATMEDDEPIYRSYYKFIDDNFKYKYNFYNVDNDLNRLYVDRRIHISAPGATTQYKIDEYYEENDINDYDKAEEIAISKVFEIIKKDQYGDILLFSTSVPKINNLCKIINNKLSFNSNIICLPFHGKLPNEWNIFDNTEKIKYITVHHTFIIDHIYLKTENYKRVPVGTYNRVIIVATNIAEASITIDSLKYVIDTGFSINIKHDYINNISKPSIEKISNTSRIQRKGRVGRVNNGVVYYIYKINSRDNIKSEYKICTENISDFIYKLLYTSYNDIDIIGNINWILHVYDYIDDDLEVGTIDLIKKNNILKVIIHDLYTYRGSILPSIYNLINKSLFIKDENCIKNFINEITNANNLEYNINNLKYLENQFIHYVRFSTGYNLKSLYDLDGTFFLIHPDENILKRNILTREFINKKNKKKNHFSNKIESYIYNLICNNYLIDIDEENNNMRAIVTSKNDLEFNKSKLLIEKTIFGILSNNIKDKFNFVDLDNSDMNKYFINTLIYSYITNNTDIVLIMICLIIESEYNINNLTNIDKDMKYDKDSPELTIYYKLAIDIFYILDKNYKVNKYNQISLMNYEKNEFLKEKMKINKNLISNKNYWKLDIPYSIYVKYNILSNKNLLDKDNINDYISESLKDNIINNDNINNEIKRLGILFDNNKIDKLIKKILTQKNILDKLINTYNIKNTNNIFEWFKKNIPIKNNKNKWINIKKAFIYGFNMNCTAIYNNENNKYTNIKYSHAFNSNSLNKHFLIVYINSIKNEFNDNIDIIIKTDIETLIELNLYYYNPITSKYLNSNKLILKFIKKFVLDYDYSICNKQNNIGHIVYNKNNSSELLNKNNNLIPHIIKLWTKIKEKEKNIFEVYLIKESQNGGTYKLEEILFLNKISLKQLIFNQL